MTTIAYRFGVLAADSRATCTAEDSGTYYVTCKKLVAKIVGRGKNRRTVWIATAGNSAPGLLFIEWYGSGKRIPDRLDAAGDSANYTALVLDRGQLHEYDLMFAPERIDDDCYALGSGAKAAMAVMLHDPTCTAAQAVIAASRVDPYTDKNIATSEGNHARAKSNRRAVYRRLAGLPRRVDCEDHRRAPRHYGALRVQASRFD